MFKYKKSVIFIVLASLIFAFIWGGKIALFTFYMVVIAIGISYLWTRAIIKRLDFSQRSMTEFAYVGDEVEIKTMVFNESFLPVPCVEVKNEMTGFITGRAANNNIITLLPFDSRSIFDRIACKYRGFYTFGPIDITVSDIFGLFTWNRQVKCDGKLSVFPRVVKLNRFNVRPMQTFGTITTKQRANEDYSSISDIRKYYPGDSYKRIHWKVSARKGSIHVKNFDMSGSTEAYIFLNLYRGDYADIYRADMEEKSVECATAIIYFMLSKNINTGFYASGEKLVYTRSRDLNEFKKFMEELIRVKSNGIIPMENLLESKARLIPRGSSIILITPRLSSGLVEKIVGLKETGYDVIIVYIAVEDLSEEHEKIIGHYGIKLCKVGLGDDIKASLEG
jgi:Uncharacterized conserved protein (some members contain a von Willebrand factor type A (vWA) domain)